MNDPRHITVMENGEPNDVDLAFDPTEWEQSIQAREEMVAKHDAAPWGRQPERVIVTLTGDKRDVHDWFVKLNSFFAGQPVGVDFELQSSRIDNNGTAKFILHPWAKND